MELEDFVIIYEDKDTNEARDRIKWITGLRYHINLDSEDFSDHAQFRDWCVEQCSDKVVFFENENWGGTTTITIYFYNEEDAVLAKLKWVNTE